MSNYIVPLAWCWLQILFVAATAIGLSLALLRRSPTAGATIAWSGVVATLALTALAFFPFPAQALQRSLAKLIARPTLPHQPSSLDPSRESPRDNEATADSGFRIPLNGPLLANLIRSLRNSESAAVRHHTTTRWILGIAAFGATIGLLRLIRGVFAISSLRKRSTSLTDSRVSHLLQELSPSLSLPHLPQVRESNDLESAAVAGWWSPIVLLPAGWQDWSPIELKAVLAHELAHIARRDAFWRLVAALAVALHWGQPLMHWLRRQLLLAQELAADELAAAAMGSKRDYLQALAKLALRQDSQPAEVPPVALLPVFSGFLLRRIVMLRAKDGSLHRNSRLLTQGIALSLVAAVALSATAIRGLAEPPDRESDGSIRVAKATDAKPRPPAPAINASDDSAFFKRPAYDISKVALKHGGFHIHLAEILQQPRFAKLAREYDESFAESWQAMFQDAKPLPFSLTDIESIAGDFKLTSGYVTPPQDAVDPRPHQLMFGASWAYIRFRQPVDEVFTWLGQTAGAEVKQHGDTHYVELMIAPLGPVKSCFARLDDHTILWSVGNDALTKRLDQLATETTTLPWESTWKAMEGGLFTAISTEVEYKGPTENVPDDEEKLAQAFFSKTRLHALGMDWQPHAGGTVTIKAQFQFDTKDYAQTIETEFRRLLKLAIQKTRENLPDAKTDKEKDFGTALISLLEQAQITTHPTDNGWQIDLQLTGPLDIESNL